MHFPTCGIFTGTLSLLLLLSFTVPLHAFRCGDGLVSIGDSKGRVLIECGKPTFKEKVGDKESRKKGTARVVCAGRLISSRNISNCQN